MNRKPPGSNGSPVDRQFSVGSQVNRQVRPGYTSGRFTPRGISPTGPVVDPDLVWWRSRGPVSVRREPAPPEVVRHRVREEDEHVHRYMVALEGGRFSNTW